MQQINKTYDSTQIHKPPTLSTPPYPSPSQASPAFTPRQLAKVQQHPALIAGGAVMDNWEMDGSFWRQQGQFFGTSVSTA